MYIYGKRMTEMSVSEMEDEILKTLGATTLNDEAEKQVYKDICYKVYMLKYKLGKELPCKQKKYEEFKQLKDELDRKESMNYIGFFTLNFNESIGLDKIKQTMIKITKKKWLTEYYYCFEQRSEDADNIKGIHVHLLFLRNGKRPAQCCSEIFNTYANLQGRKYADVKNFDYKFYPYDFLKDKQEYMIGDKWDKSKLKKVDVDKIWRNANDLQLIYGTADPYDLGVCLCGDTPCECLPLCECSPTESCEVCIVCTCPKPRDWSVPCLCYSSLLL